MVAPLNCALGGEVCYIAVRFAATEENVVNLVSYDS